MNNYFKQSATLLRQLTYPLFLAILMKMLLKKEFKDYLNMSKKLMETQLI